MKLATLRNGRPDGQLVVVSRDLRHFVSAGRIAPDLQTALDSWETLAPELHRLSEALDTGGIAAQPFEAHMAMAPLPRAYQWIDGAGYLGHLERVRSLQGSKDAELQSERPLLYQGGSDSLSGPTDPIIVPEEDLALDFEAEVAAILGPVPMRPGREQAAAAIRLVTICNDVSLRRLVVDDLQNGFGFFHAKPATAFAPVVATPDELGDLWDGQKLSARLQVYVNDVLFGQPNAGVDMHFDFVDLIVEAARTRTLGPGTIIGSGTVANRHEESLPIKRDGIGFACIAEARTVEKAKYGRARTPFLKSGDSVKMAALDRMDQPIFGAITQRVSILGK
ncbi:FAA hydrolase family protein [Arsenicitalea aurantiaca]|uniref:FAA hydrolase family protein n=1 Tax=Arsenicitalea aurantiaca TaxID=1783274 RepID=A0A433XA06_9HYPH|nr:fumarylacetoacetate hydrolase family protein [Arsenicitalea aurantiaca]RUT30936.1 FAA hydrolase family protein [Arsenicitalea aurantiaca]